MSKSNENCCVYNCSSLRRRNQQLMFHLFPPVGRKIRITNEFGMSEICDSRKLWIFKLKMGKSVTRYMKVCSRHFTEDDYECSGWSSRKRLKYSAVPSQNLPVGSHETSKWINDRKAISRRARKTTRSSSSTTSQDDVIHAINENHHDEAAVKGLLLLGSAVTNFSTDPSHAPHDADESINEKSTQVDFSGLTVKKDAATQLNCGEILHYKHAAVQVDTRDLLTVGNFIKTEKQLNCLTGIYSFELLNALVTILEGIKKDQRIHRLLVYQRVLLFFMKLKLDLPYAVLSVFFGVSAQTCKKTFFDLTANLSAVLRTVIPFPSCEEIKANLPKCFKEFSNVRIILDCTEIPCQRPQNLCCRIKFYSHYKGTTTVKFMTGVTPAGLITHVSPPYGGRVSDSAIFKQSGILQLLSKGEAVMVDKGFLIDEICKQHGITLIRPPFLKQKKQFSHEEAVLNAKIASARVHIERSNQRIKLFKILNNRLPVNLLPIVGDILVVICGIVNLSNPILSEDKFLCV